MSASIPPPGGGPEPAPPAPPTRHEDHDFSPLLDLLQRFHDLFEEYVLERLDPAARASLARAGSAFLEVVFPRSIFPFGLPACAVTTRSGVAGRRVFKLVDFLGSAERLAWAKANGCPWVARTCQLRRSGRAPGGAAVGAGARLSVGLSDVLRRRCERASGRVAVGARARCPVGFDDLFFRRPWRAPGRAAVGAGARVPVG